ncbi:hypothetical protein IAU60_001702 [Kwoniella sp. DSM 27419]
MPISFPRPGQSTSAGTHSPAHSSSSLPSYPSSIGSDADTDSDSGSDGSDLDDDAEVQAMIQEEWEESLKQLEMVVSIMIIPYFGKWFGRMWSYWAWARYQRLGGLNRPFFGLKP